MSELISREEAKLAWANNKEVEYMPLNKWNLLGGSTPLSIFDRDDVKFRLKPRTITINGIEVPAPFEPKEDCLVYILDDSRQEGFREYDYDIEDTGALFFGVWRDKDEIKQVVSALRSVFKGGV